MTSILGVTIGDAANPQVRNYHTGSLGQRVLNSESVFRAESNRPNMRWGANRMHYKFFTSPFLTLAAADTDINADHANDRLPVVTVKYSGAGEWANIAAATTSSTYYTNIANFADGLAAWQAAHAGLGKWGASMVFSFHHEMNQGPTINNNGGGSGSTAAIAPAAANWRAAYEKVLSIFRARNVMFWSGGNDWSTTTEGIMPIVCQVGGTTGATNGVGVDQQMDVWWPPTDTFMNDNMVGAMPDIYNGIGFATTHSINHIVDFTRTWCQGRYAAQAARSPSRPFLTGMLEFGANEWLGSDSPNLSIMHSCWTAKHPGVTYSKALWLQDAEDYFRTLWPEFGLLCYWDANSPSTTATESNPIDSSNAAWASYLTNFMNNSRWNTGEQPIVVEPPPPQPGVFVPGVVSPIRMVNL